MKKKAKASEDLCYKFWKEYERADYIKREKLLLPIIRNFASIINIKDEKICRHALNTYLHSYFDDLIDYFYYKENKPKTKS